MDRADYWLTKFSHLRIDRARGDPAPHKPLLLLAACDLAESGELRDAPPLSPELMFGCCGGIVMSPGLQASAASPLSPLQFPGISNN